MPPKKQSKPASKPAAAKLNCESLRKEDLIAIIDAEVAENGLINHHMSSFNDFTGSGMPQIVTQLFKVKNVFDPERNKTEEDLAIKTVKYTVKFNKIELKKPGWHKRTGVAEALSPYMARRHDLNYSSVMTVDATVKATAYPRDGGEPIRKEPVEILNHRIGQLPIMIGSTQCNLHGLPREARKKEGEDPEDPGGYFILKGGEWAISIIESRKYNFPNTFRNVGHEKELSRLEMISKPGDYFENSSELIIRYLNTGHIYFTFTSENYLKALNIPFYVLFRLFGMNSDKEIFDNIVYGYSTEKEPNVISDRIVKILRRAMGVSDPQFGDFHNLTDQAEVLVKFCEAAAANSKSGGYRTRDAESTKLYLLEKMFGILDERVLPHIGMARDSQHDKLRYLGHLINHMLLVEMEVAPQTDRDSLRNKRLVPAGQAYAKTFKRDFNVTVVQDIIKKFRNDFKSTPFSKVNLKHSFISAIDSGKLERNLNSAIVVGNKEITVSNRQVPNRLASEILHRKNQLNYLSTLRVIRTPSTSSSKQDQRADEMRRVHPSYIGYICLIQSADTGEQVGMVKQLALSAGISKSSSSEALKETIRNDKDIVRINRVRPEIIYSEKLTKVMVNGYWIGCCKDAKKVVTKYREYRRGFQFAAGSDSRDDITLRLTNI
jgi:DNA-directed RNA polymerase beta subunit